MHSIIMRNFGYFLIFLTLRLNLVFGITKREATAQDTPLLGVAEPNFAALAGLQGLPG